MYLPTMAALNSAIPASVSRSQTNSSQDEPNASACKQIGPPIHPKPNKKSFISLCQQHGYEYFELQNNPTTSESGGEARNPETCYEDVTTPPQTSPTRTLNRLNPEPDDLCSGGSPSMATRSKINPELMRSFEELLDRNQSKSDGVSVGSEDNERKYKASSLGVLFKSTGTTSKLPTESITERVTLKSIMFANWGSKASNKMKTVSKADDKLYESWRQMRDGSSASADSEPTENNGFLEMRELAPMKSKNFQEDILFASPLNSTINHREYLVSTAYGIPKSVKPVKLEKHRTCLNPMNEALTSFTIQENTRSETNLENGNYKNYIDPDRKVDITERITMESLSSGENQYEEMDIPEHMVPNSSDKEKNVLETLKGVTLKKKTVENSSKKDAALHILPQTSSSTDELHSKLNLPSNIWNFFNVTNRDGEHGNDSDDDSSPESTLEASRVNEDQIYESICEFTTETLTAGQPPLPRRNKARSLMHQNRPSKNIENLVEETTVDPYFAVVAQGTAKQSSWLVSDNATTPEAEKFTKLSSRNERADSKAVVEGEHYLPLSAMKCKPTAQSTKPDTSMLIIPKPLLTERLIGHQGIVLKSLTGMVTEMFNEWTLCSMVLREKFIQTYNDLQQTQRKETLQLKFMVSLQSIIEPKFNIQRGHDLYCFEVVLEENFAENQQVIADPNLVTTSRNYGNVKTQRKSHMFAVQKRSDRNLWMAKIVQSVADVFPETYLTEFDRAGWCYMKKSLSSSWSGAWLLLAKRKLYFFNDQHRQLGLLDLRNVNCIGEIESDESITNLHTESGPSLFIDCLPYATLYFIMATSQETQIWKKIINSAGHKNGTNMLTQHLTKNEVPVLIDKCINFIYVHGSMSEGIYRKCGSSIKVSKILQLFKEDAFSVQLTREEFSEHDVTGALKKFIREIPDSFFGSYVNSFISITSLKSTEDKIFSYIELLSRLSKIEYQTLKKLIGHLSFIASLEKHNKMDVADLSKIWGSILMTNSSHQFEDHPQDEADVVVDLIRLYKNLFPISPEEIEKEQLMWKALQKYHASAESLFDTVKHSGDLQVWITIEIDIETARCTSNEDKMQINVTLTPTKTASDICKELASRTPIEWYKLTLFEVICDGTLVRPVHYNEKALGIVLKWSNWDDADRKSNYLAVRPTLTLSGILRIIQQAPVLTPTTELKFADRRTKALPSYKLKLIGRQIVVFKQVNKKKEVLYEELLKINLQTVHAYLGMEAKRRQSSLRWAITLVEHDFEKRTRNAPFIGHILGGLDFTDQILWYSSILHCLYQDDILPSSDFYSSTWWTGRRPLART